MTSIDLMPLRRIALFLLLIVAAPAADAQTETARWRAQAARVTIVRDDWGIAHVRGRSDADAVFGMVYAQAEDDFNRVETNFINAMRRLVKDDECGCFKSRLLRRHRFVIRD